MIIIFTPQERPTPPNRSHAGRNALHQSRREPDRPLPDASVEEEAVFTDPFGADGTSRR